ncbi:MAG: hypothetical protein U0271_03895 [Polyangiaceae bacterium]
MLGISRTSTFPIESFESPKEAPRHSVIPLAPGSHPDALPGEPRLRGALLRELALGFERRFGREVLVSFLDATAESDRMNLNRDGPAFGIAVNGWYSAKTFEALFDAALAGLAPSVAAFAIREVAAEAVRHLSRGLYAELFHRLNSPELFVDHAPTAWRYLSTSGHLTAASVLGRCEITISAWPGHSAAMCIVMGQFFQGAFAHMACRDVTLEHVGCVARGHPECHYRVRYHDPP